MTVTKGESRLDKLRKLSAIPRPVIAGPSLASMLGPPKRKPNQNEREVVAHAPVVQTEEEPAEVIEGSPQHEAIPPQPEREQEPAMGRGEPEVPKCPKCGKPKTMREGGSRWNCVPCRAPMNGPKRKARGIIAGEIKPEVVVLAPRHPGPRPYLKKSIERRAKEDADPLARLVAAAAALTAAKAELEAAIAAYSAAL